MASKSLPINAACKKINIKGTNSEKIERLICLDRSAGLRTETKSEKARNMTSSPKEFSAFSLLANQCSMMRLNMNATPRPPRLPAC